MTIKQLKEKLDKAIEEGKEDYKVKVILNGADSDAIGDVDNPIFADKAKELWL